jgi:type I restriction enzyme S subunit
MNNLKPYTKYKPSGIAWLGDIPEHWEVRKLKYLAKIKTGRTPKIENAQIDYFENGDLNWFTPGDFNENGNLIYSKRRVIDKAFESKQLDLFPENTVYLVSIGATIGKVGISLKKGSSNQQINALIFKEYIMPKFGYYSMKISKNQIDTLADFTTLPILNQTKNKEILFSVPPIPEQTTIAAFLDYKIAKIDRFIFKKKQLIKLLNEQKAVSPQASTSLPEPRFTRTLLLKKQRHGRLARDTSENRTKRS